MSTNQTNIAAYIAYLNAISSTISYYTTWIVWTFGVVSNLFSFYIFTRPNLNKNTNTGFLYGWLCILNVPTLIYYAFVYRSSSLFGYTVPAYPCGIIEFFRRTLLNSISWMQVIICLDRFVIVLIPRKAKWFNKKRVLYSVMLGLFALVLITNITNLLSYPVTTISSNVSTTSCTTTTQMTVASNLLAYLMRIFLPFILMITLNLIVIRRLKSSKIRVSVASLANRMGPETIQRNQRQFTNKDRRFTVSTIIIDFIFLFFYFPLGVYYILSIYNTFSGWLSANSFSNACFNLFSNIAQLLALGHSCFLLFVFVIFNRYFRDEIIDLLRLRRFFSQPNVNMS